MSKQVQFITVENVTKYETLEQLILNELSYKAICKIANSARQSSFIDPAALPLMHEKYATEISYAGYLVNHKRDESVVLSPADYPDKTAYMAVAAHCSAYQADYKGKIKNPDKTVVENAKEDPGAEIEI